MAIFIESITYTPETNFGSGTVNHLLGAIQQKIVMLARLRIETQILPTADEPILMDDPTFLAGGFIVDVAGLERFADVNIGDTLTLVSASPGTLNAAYAIIEKLDNNTIRTSTTINPQNTLLDNGVFFTDFRAKGITLDFDFIENDEGASFASLIDGALQRYSYGTSSAIPSSLTAMIPQGSPTWRFNGTSARTREVSWDDTIKVQTIEVEQTFYINPFYLISQFFEITNTPPLPPSYFNFLNCLKHAFRVRGYKDIQNPNIFQEYLQEDILGNTGWFIESLNGNIANYTKDSISYASPLQADTTARVVTAVITCAGDVLVDSGENRTAVVLNFMSLPNLFEDYGNNNKTASQNYTFDRAYQTLGTTAVNGEGNATALQVIKTFTAVKTNATTVTLTFTIQLSAEIAAMIAGRNYVISAYLCNRATTYQYTDVANVILDVKQIEEAPINILDDIEHAFVAIGNATEIVDGDADIAQVSETISKLTLQHLAATNTVPTQANARIYVKLGANEVTLQEWSAQLQGAYVNDYPFAALNVPSGLPALLTEPQGAIKITTTADLLEFIYPFFARYEEWQQVILNNPAAFGFDVTKPFNGINHDWARWAQLGSVEFRVYQSISYANGFVAEIDKAINTLAAVNQSLGHFTDGVITIREVVGNADIGFIPTDRESVVQLVCDTAVAAAKYVIFYGFVKRTGEYINLSSASSLVNRDALGGFLRNTVTINYVDPVLTATCRINPALLPQGEEISVFAHVGRESVFNTVQSFGADFEIVRNVPVAPTPPELEDNTNKACCYIPLALADVSSSDALRNDTSLFFERFSKSVTSAPVKLQKLIAGVWVDQATITTGSYGTLYALGFAVRNSFKYLAYLLNWKHVLATHGHGCYRLDMGGKPSQVYDLKHYNAINANNTTRISYTLNSVLGGVLPEDVIDYSGLNLSGQVRLSNSIFGQPNLPHTIEKQRYENGLEVDHVNELRRQYRLNIKSISFDFLEWLSVTVLQADEILITDYNANNGSKFVDVSVKLASAIEPQNTYGNCNVSITFESAYNNNRKIFY